MIIFRIIRPGREPLTCATKRPGRRAARPLARTLGSDRGMGHPCPEVGSTEEMAIGERVERFGFSGEPIPVGFRARIRQGIRAGRFAADRPKRLEGPPDTAAEPADLGAGHFDPVHQEFRDGSLVPFCRRVGNRPDDLGAAHKPRGLFPSRGLFRKQSMPVDGRHVSSWRDVEQNQPLR